jgi:hypothetical protein
VYRTGKIVTVKQQRLEATRDNEQPWKKWGPYLSERQWGTVREDYSEDGNAWNYTPTIKRAQGMLFNGSKYGK